MREVQEELVVLEEGFEQGNILACCVAGMAMIIQ